MQIQFLSDIHIEHHHDGGASFIGKLDPTNVDVLVIAGDTCTHTQISLAFSVLCDMYPEIVVVAGNHEYYGTSFSKVRELFETAQKEFPNLHWLENSSVTLDKVRFVGTTLWFPDGKENATYQASLNDFRCITDFKEEVYKKNTQAQNYLKSTINEADIVVTHHLPSYKSVPAPFVGSLLNRFFLCPMDKLIEKRQPRLWLHGHSHLSSDYKIGKTHILCNPYGYAGIETNPDFNVKFLIDL